MTKDIKQKNKKEKKLKENARSFYSRLKVKHLFFGLVILALLAAITLLTPSLFQGYLRWTLNCEEEIDLGRTNLKRGCRYFNSELNLDFRLENLNSQEIFVNFENDLEDEIRISKNEVFIFPAEENFVYRISYIDLDSSQNPTISLEKVAASPNNQAYLNGSNYLSNNSQPQEESSTTEETDQEEENQTQTQEPEIEPEVEETQTQENQLSEEEIEILRVENEIASKKEAGSNLELARSLMENSYQNLELWNDGEDYGPTFRANLEALDEGEELVIPAGRYIFGNNPTIDNIIVSYVSFKDGITIKAENLGEVIFEIPEGTTDTEFFYIFDNKDIQIENIIFYNSEGHNMTAIRLITENVRIFNNIFYNFGTSGVRMQSSDTREVYSRNNIVEANFFFDNGYNPVDARGNRTACDDNGAVCDNIVYGSKIKNNYFDGNYQAINLNCSEGSIVEGNFVTNTELSGLRVETSKSTLAKDNILFENGQGGINLYACTEDTTLENNIVIDNNRRKKPYTADCWRAQQTIVDAFFTRDNPLVYPEVFENGENIFQHVLCQSNGHEIELRNNVDNTIIRENIVGRFETIKYNEKDHSSPFDLYLSFFPQFAPYSRNSNFLSDNTTIEDNIFLNSSSARIKNLGCNASFNDNTLINSQNLSLIPFNLILEDYSLCRFDRDTECGEGKNRCPVCDFDGVCEVMDGENSYICDDCSGLNLGERGSKQNNDRCLEGNQLEAIYPARDNQCKNFYDGSFVCAECKEDGICDVENGENACNCSFDCDEVFPVCGNGICEAGEFWNSCSVDCGEN